MWSLLPQLREPFTLVREALVVHDVPVEHVHLVHGQSVQRLQNVRQRNEVARRVQQQTTVEIPREICYGRFVDTYFLQFLRILC